VVVLVETMAHLLALVVMVVVVLVELTEPMLVKMELLILVVVVVVQILTSPRVVLVDQVSLSFDTQATLQLLLALDLPQLQQSLEPMKSQQLPQVPAT
jgi:hypothetical protein